jgi:uncharacterized protein YoxC
LDTIFTISQIILLLSAAALLIYLISAIGKIVKTFQNIGNSISHLDQSVSEIQKKLSPLIDNANSFIDQSKKVTETIAGQAEQIKSTIQIFKLVALDILQLERNLKEAIEKPAVDFLNTFMGILSGIKSVTNFLKKPKTE